MGSHPLEVVLASAGTGKTFRLTNRYLALVLDAGDRSKAARIAPRILATTFTRKAAGEIRDRIVSRLSAGAASEDGAKKLGAELEMRLAAPQCADVLRGVCDALGDLRVMTIDSLLVGMVLRSSHECGLADGWRLGEIEEDEALQADAIDGVLAHSDQEDLLAFLHILHQSGYGRTVHREIANAVGAAYAVYLGTRNTPEVWERVEAGEYSFSGEAIANLCERLEQLDAPLTGAGKPDKRWLKAFVSTSIQLLEKNWGGLLGGGIGGKVIRGETEYSSHEIVGGVLDVYREIVGTAVAAIRTNLKRRNLAVRELMEGYHHAYRHAKSESGVYIFDDMPRVLAEADERGDLLGLRYQLDGSVDHVLLDEFQDTSVAQFALLRPIVEELIGSGGGRSVFVVGDVKQSLYGWRDAERDLLPGLKSLLWPEAATQSMSRSYRSAPIVMDSVNRVFESVAGLPALADSAGAREWGESFELHESAPHLSVVGGAVRLIEATLEEDEDRTGAVVRCVAGRVALAKRASPGCSIGVLVRRRERIPAIVTAVRALGYDAVEEGGNPITDSPAVCAALSLLQLADHPGDTMALYHLGTSEFAAQLGIDDPRDASVGRRIGKLYRQRLIEEGYEHVLRSVIGSCDAGFSERDRARFDQLLELAGEYDLRAGTRPGAFVEMAELRRIDEPTRGSVRVMTVHGSKGLEFDCVILGDLESRWNLRHGGVLTSREDVISPISVASLYPNEEARLASDVLDGLYERAKKKLHIEELCVLYVAMTRAARVLEMIVEPRKHDGASAANILRDALCDSDTKEIEEGVLYENVAGRWWDDIDVDDAPVGAGLSSVVRWEISAGEEIAWTTGSGSAHSSVGPLSALLDSERRRAMARGSVVHQWMERVGWIDDGLPGREVLLDDAVRIGYPAEKATELMDTWLGWMESPGVVVGMRKPVWDECDSVVVRNEWGYHLRADTGASGVVTGIIDRLVVGYRGGRVVRAHVIDYKTDVGDVAEICARYAGQVRSYMQAVARVFGLGSESVSGRLLLLAEGHAGDVAYESPDEGASEAAR